MTRSSLLTRRHVVGDYLYGAVWVLPTLGITLGVVAGVGLSIIEVTPGSLLDKLTFQGTANDARQVLTVVSATMITTTALVFALTVLSLQIASSQYSLRLLRTFLRDIGNQAVLAIFVFTFAYSTGGLYVVGERVHGEAFVPEVAVSGALVLAFVSTGALVYFLHHLMHSIQIDSIMERAQRRTLRLIDDLFPDIDTPNRAVETQPAPPPEAVPLLAPRSGYLQAVDVDDIAEEAAANGHTALLVTFVGDYVTRGGLLGWCWQRGDPPRPPDPRFLRRCLRHVRIGFERTMAQDIRFGLRQIIDIALRALSPAINDPYTGIQAVHHVSAIVSVLAARKLSDDVRHGGSGAILVWLPYPRFATYLHMACSQILRYGARDSLVPAAILQLLSAVAHNCVDPSRRAAVQSQIDLVVRVSQRALTEESDLIMVNDLAARATEMVAQPGAPLTPSVFGMAASAAAAARAAQDGCDETARGDVGQERPVARRD